MVTGSVGGMLVQSVGRPAIKVELVNEELTPSSGNGQMLPVTVACHVTSDGRRRRGLDEMDGRQPEVLGIVSRQAEVDARRQQIKRRQVEGPQNLDLVVQCEENVLAVARCEKS